MAYVILLKMKIKENGKNNNNKGKLENIEEGNSKSHSSFRSQIIDSIKRKQSFRKSKTLVKSKLLGDEFEMNSDENDEDIFEGVNISSLNSPEKPSIKELAFISNSSINWMRSLGSTHE